MKNVSVKELFLSPQSFDGQEIAISGWLRTVRDSKVFGFLEINDGSTVGSLQAIIEDKLPNFSELVKLNVGAAVRAEGLLVCTPEARQPFELKASAVSVEAASTPDYPLQKKRHSLEYLRTIPHLRPRTNTFMSVFRVRSEAAFAIHDFFHRRGFVYVHTPIITGSDAEGAGQMFRVTTLEIIPKNGEGKHDFSGDFFGRETHLTVSGQLEAETFALAFGKTYTFGPTFRAENSNTARHAAEFWMIEPEIAFAELADDMALAEDMVKFVVNHVLEACPQEMEFLGKHIDPELATRLEAVRSAKFGHMTYTEAVAELLRHKDKFEYPVYWGCDLQTEHERFLTEQVMKRPVFVTDYPREIKAFYMRNNDDGKTVAAMDLLTPGVGELIGGSQREERLDRLEARMREMNMPTEMYDWYLDLRRFGGVKHAGFGLGFERLVMYLTGIGNIRDAAAFPRTVGSLQL